MLGAHGQRLEGKSHPALAGDSTFTNAAGIWPLSICLPMCWRDSKRKWNKSLGSDPAEAMPWPGVDPSRGGRAAASALQEQGGLPLPAGGKRDENPVCVAGNSWADVLSSPKGAGGDVTGCVWCF